MVNPRRPLRTNKRYMMGPGDRWRPTLLICSITWIYAASDWYALCGCCLVVRPSRHFNTQRGVWDDTQKMYVYIPFRFARIIISTVQFVSPRLQTMMIPRRQRRSERVNTKCCAMEIACNLREAQSEMKTSSVCRSNWFCVLRFFFVDDGSSHRSTLVELDLGSSLLNSTRCC